jgi:serine protease
MQRRALKLATAAMLSAACVTAATGAAPATSAAGQRQVPFVPGQLVVRLKDQAVGRVLHLPSGIAVRQATRALRRNPRVAYAVPNSIATISAALPNDPGAFPSSAGSPGGWVTKQWNFLPCGSFCSPGSEPLAYQSPGGINATGAWRNLRKEGEPGAAGVRIAILDTGIAYRRLGSRFRRSPDFLAKQFIPGYDFIAKNARPLDRNGHGTHVAGTIAERTGNGIALTGLAYNARIMPVRVLDSGGHGNAATIAKGIRFAAEHGAQVINMSFNFACGDPAKPVAAALRFAHENGVVLVAAIGNDAPIGCIAMPADTRGVIAVGGTTEGGCLGSYSRIGGRVDLVAPGGGIPAGSCPQLGIRPIYQLTFERDPRHFSEPPFYEGTSMAAAHVSAVAAMVLASGVLGRHPDPDQVLARLQATARDLGPPGKDEDFGAGLIDAAAATRR